MDGFTFGKLEGVTGYRYSLLTLADEMHLHSAFVGIVKSVVRKRPQVEISSQLPVNVL